MNISIRYKFLLGLVLIPTISILFYFLFVINLFQKDKESYIFESALSVSQGISGVFNKEINLVKTVITPLIQGIQIEENKFDEISEKTFQEIPFLEGLYVFETEGKILTSLKKSSAKELSFSSSFLQESSFENKQEYFIYSLKTKDKKTNRDFIFAISFKSKDLKELFNQSALYSSFLVSQKGETLIEARGLNIENFSTFDFWQDIADQVLSAGTLVGQIQNNLYYVSFSETILPNVKILTLIEQQKANKALEVLKEKSFLFIIAIISFCLIIAFLFSNKITKSLIALTLATKKISSGNYNIKLDVESKDEVGTLTEDFNSMAHKITELLEETAEKARMESELKTAKFVQDTLFPTPFAQFSNIDISGFYRSASECGGDWWHYEKVKNYLFFYIGDATGHGAASALITAACKSAVSVLHKHNENSPKNILSSINQSIHDLAKGKMCMTMFVGRYNLDTSELTFSLAGHEPPLIFKKDSSGNYNRKNLTALNEANSNRCGESKDTLYEESSVLLEPQDIILFYTDGMTDIQSPDGKVWGERKFLSNTIDFINQGYRKEKLIQAVTQSADIFRDNYTQLDDMTYFLCEIKKAA